MFLVFIPLYSLCKAFWEYGLRRKPSKRKSRKRPIPRRTLGHNTSTSGGIYSDSLPEARISEHSVHNLDEVLDGDGVEREGHNTSTLGGRISEQSADNLDEVLDDASVEREDEKETRIRTNSLLV